MFKKIILVFGLLILSAGINADNTVEIHDDVEALCWTGDQITGPIWNNDHAKQVCPAVCSNINGTWTGNWVTVIWGERSVCNCRVC